MYRYPLGVVGGIAPFNSHDGALLDVPAGHCLRRHLRAKPSDRTPLTVIGQAELFKEAGLPDGVFNIVHGRQDVVNGLIEHARTSRQSRLSVHSRSRNTSTSARRHSKRVQALGGAKNHTIVLPDADLDLAVNRNTGCFGFGR